ncbi:MAG: Sip1-related alpha-galactosidase [Promethearchaeia archaeon]
MNFEIKHGILNFDGKELLSHLPQGTTINQNQYKDNEVFLSFSKPKKFSLTYWSGMQLAKLIRFTSLFRALPYWFRPYFGNKESEIPKRSIILWYERSDGFIVTLIPLIDKGYNLYLNGNQDGLELMADNNCETGRIRVLRGLYIRVGNNLYEMLEKASKSICEFVDAGTLRKDKRVPEWAEYLGYCTWNTFYRKVNQEKLIRMVHTIVKKKGINLGYVLLDDGWQKTRFRKLLDKGVDRKKFPDGLNGTIKFIKTRFDVSFFLVWHTFQGYWSNIAIHFSPYGEKFKITKNLPQYGPSYPNMSIYSKWIKGINKLQHALKYHYGVLYPEQMREFWDDYHGWLASQGVDGVKVDNQSGMELQTYNMGYQAHMMRKYHRVLEESVSSHFSPYSIINCMSQNTNVYYQLNESNITRNSNDYFPEKEKKQTTHIIYNAYNNLWCGKFAHPDWDMFQTEHPWGEYQAAARAISGSPVYFADNFKEVNAQVLKKLVLPNGRILRCKEPALLAQENLFHNPAKPGRALKIFNYNRLNSIVGLFNVMQKSETKTSFTPTLVEKFRKRRNEGHFAIYKFRTQKLSTLQLNTSITINLGIKGFELFTIAEIKDGFAPIGILTMYNSGGIFEKIKRKENRIEVKLLYGGLIGFYSEQNPHKILINENKKAKFDYNESTKLLTVSVDREQAPHISLIF